MEPEGKHKMIWKFIINTGWLLLVIAISGLVYVRFAPDDIAAVHVRPPVVLDMDRILKFDHRKLRAVIHASPVKTVLEQMNTVALDTPRTQVLAGSIQENLLTYVTRSNVFGFPDYTTVFIEPDGQGSRLTIHARQRFGKADFGVNASRVRDWLSRLEALIS